MSICKDPCGSLVDHDAANKFQSVNIDNNKIIIIIIIIFVVLVKKIVLLRDTFLIRTTQL
jgi:hypothetical protein